MTESVQVDVAAMGWQHTQWRGEFYPIDLPDDWFLGYYANEFHSVAIPYAHWCQFDQDDIVACLDEVTDQFRFYVELSAHQLDTQDCVKLSTLGMQLAGILLTIPNAHYDLHVIQTVCQFAQENSKSVSLLDPLQICSDTELESIGHTDTMSRCQQWTAQQAEPLLPNQGMVLVNCERETEYKRINELMTNVVHAERGLAAEVPSVALIVIGTPPDIVILKRIQQIQQLLGVA